MLSLVEYYICSDIRVPTILKTYILVLLDMVMHMMLVLPVLKNRLRAVDLFKCHENVPQASAHEVYTCS